MKAFNTIVKILTALAAVAGAVYLLATYGDKLVAWAKKLLSCGCCCEEDCCCEGECCCDEECCEDECCCAQETAEEAPAVEAPAQETPAEENAAEESDFA